MSYRPLLGCVWASILLAVAAFRIGAFLWVWLPLKRGSPTFTG